MSLLFNEERAHGPSTEGASKSDGPGRGTLLPSVFPNDEPTNPSAEGYEGEKLHEMFLSSKAQARNLPNEARDAEPEMDDNDGDEAAQLDSAINFEPFFTVIEDVSTGTQHHPHVYYVFSDDDPDLLTNAMLNTIDPNFQNANEDADKTEPNLPVETTRARCIIVDVDHSGESIVAARSLTPSWQVLGHAITTAPTFGENSQRQEAGLMLRIEGQEGLSEADAETFSNSLAQGKDATSDELLESVNRLATQFHGELNSLRRLVPTDPGLDLLTGEVDST